MVVVLGSLPGFPFREEPHSFRESVDSACRLHFRLIFKVSWPLKEFSI